MKTTAHAGIRHRFAEILKDSGLTVKQLSQMLNISQATVMRLINEANTPSLQTAYDVLIKFPEVRPEWLILGKGRKKADELEANAIRVEQKLLDWVKTKL
mgnify:CR=1 FL=1